jgi:hypothetical protein
VPSYRPIQNVRVSKDAPQLVTGSGEGQNLTNIAVDKKMRSGTDCQSSDGLPGNVGIPSGRHSVMHGFS